MFIIYERDANTHYIGGQLEILSLPLHPDFKQIRLTPEEARHQFRKLGWQRIVSFITRNPIHRPQFEMTLRAMRQAKANLLLLPIAGDTKPGDFDHYTRVRCYHKMTRHYPPDAYFLNLLPLAIRMAGPPERASPCHHFKKLRVHPPYYRPGPCKPRDRQPPARLFMRKTPPKKYSGNSVKKSASSQYLSMKWFICPLKMNFGLSIMSRKVAGPSLSQVRISGKGFAPEDRFRTGATFPAVLQELLKAYPPPRHQGLTIFLTGLSGAGKSTIAKVLYSKFLEMGDRPVTLLDGDIVRHNLSSELSFSKEHRDVTCPPDRIRRQRNYKKPGHCHLRTHCALCQNP